MIPLKDSVRSRTRPWVSVSLIAANLAVFAYELRLPQDGLTALFHAYGLVPARVVGQISGGPAGASAAFPVTLVTATFIHGGWLHVLGNMLYLWVFGDNVEDRLGRVKYLVFYLGAGAAANLAHVLANPSSQVPTVGASGAVAGVLGAYFITFPRARVLALIPVGIFIPIAQVPAVFFLVLWFFLQLVNGVASLGVPSQAAQGVAWWAHVGGFSAGIALMLLLRPRAARRRW